MRLTLEQAENVIGFLLEECGSRMGFVRVNPNDIEGHHVVLKQDGPDWLITSYQDGALGTDKFPIVKGMGS